MTSKPASRTAAQFVLRLPDGMRERIAELAKQNNRSMNAEIVQRLEWSLKFQSEPQVVNVPSSSQPIPEIRIALDTGDEPICWDEISDIIAAVRKKLEINAVSMHVRVLTPELASSSDRAQQAAELAEKLQSKPYSAQGVAVDHARPKRIRRPAAKKT